MLQDTCMSTIKIHCKSRMLLLRLCDVLEILWERKNTDTFIHIWIILKVILNSLQFLFGQRWSATFLKCKKKYKICIQNKKYI